MTTASASRLAFIPKLFMRFLSQTIRHGLSMGILYGFVVMAFLLFFAEPLNDVLMLLLVGAIIVGLYSLSAAIFLGTIGGVWLTLLTLFTPPGLYYRLAVGSVALLSPFSMALFLYLVNASYQDDSWLWLLVFGALPILIGVGTAVYVADHTAKWYLEQAH